MISSLLAIKKGILEKFEREWNEHLKTIIPQEAIENELTIGSLVRDFGGDMNKYLDSLKPAVAKRFVSCVIKEVAKRQRQNRRQRRKGQQNWQQRKLQKWNKYRKCEDLEGLH